MSYGKNEFIKLNRRFLVWSRYKNVNDKVVFIHCLLKANWKDGEWKGVPVKRGQFISSVSKIAEECGLTYSKVRTSLDHLIFDENIETNVLDLSQEHSRKHLQGKPTLFTVVDYDKYQAFSENIETNSQEFSENNLRSLTTIEEVKNRERSKEVKKELSKDNSNKATSSLTGMIDEKIYTEALKTKIKEWLKYKSEKKQGYKKTGFNVFLSKVDKALEENDEDAVIECFDNAMSHNWSGVFFDKLQGSKKNTFNAEEFLRRFEDE